MTIAPPKRRRTEPHVIKPGEWRLVEELSPKGTAKMSSTSNPYPKEDLVDSPTPESETEAKTEQEGEGSPGKCPEEERSNRDREPDVTFLEVFANIIGCVVLGIFAAAGVLFIGKVTIELGGLAMHFLLTNFGVFRYDFFR